MTINNHVDENRRRLLAWSGLIACTAGLGIRNAVAGETPGARLPGVRDDALESALSGGFRRSEMVCKVPKLSLVRQDGSTARFPEELDDGWALIVSFFRTSCSTTCRLNGRILSEVQNRLGSEMARVRFLSISVDPGNDTPERLREYAEQVGAHPQWQFYTGSPDACAALQSAFSVGHPERHDHAPVTFLRGAPCYKWVRLDGFAGPDALLHEFRNLARLTA